jgi:hypothetical protein
MVGMGNNVYGRARHVDLLINQTNTSGGVKKQGLPSTVGLTATVSGVYRKRVGCLCPTAYSVIVKNISCGTNVGGRIVKPRC